MSLTSLTIHRQGSKNNETFVGVDASLNSTGVCIIEGPTVHLYRVIAGKLRGTERLLYLYERLKDVLGPFQGTCVGAVENGAYEAGGRIYQLGQAQGISQIVLAQFGMSVVEVGPTRLKKFFADHGSASKRRMVEHADALLGSTDLQDDMADAFALAYLLETWRSNSPHTRKQAEVILDLQEEYSPWES